MRTRQFILLSGLCLLPSMVFCQSSEEDTNRFSYSFIFSQGSADIRPQLGDNFMEFSRLDEFIRTTFRTDSLSLLHFRLISYCSIEGGNDFNSLLSRQRVEGFRDYLQNTYPLFIKNCTFNIDTVHEDWHGLAELVWQDNEVPEREEVLSILHNGASNESRKQLLQFLNGSKAFMYMKEHILPRLRRVEVEVSSQPSLSSQSSPSAPMGHLPLAGEEFDAAWNSSPARGRYPIGVEGVMAIKTNLLYFAGLTHEGKHITIMPNLSIEYFLSSHWSVEAGVKYSNWHYNDGQAFQGISGYRLETRYYFRDVYSNTLISPYIGIYGRFGDFNLHNAHTQTTIHSRLSTTGQYIDVGVSGGVNLRLSRQWGLEIGARGGYVSSTSTAYQMHDDHNCYEFEISYNKFRLTDLNISLIYRF